MKLPATFIDQVRESGVVVLAGAGVSMLAPASLPGWRDFNHAVVEALAERTARDTNRGYVDAFVGGILRGREAERVYAPDFMAQLIEEELGADYFRVLQVLDGEACNLNHLLIAALAKAGHLRAVVTTNFDRLIERALDAAGVPYRVFAAAEEFKQIAAAEALPVVKAHGSVERPETMVDTLAQRVRGRPRALNDALAGWLRRHAWLAIGFSGADLDYDPGYLGLRLAAADARALLVLVQQGTEPLPALRHLMDDFGPRGQLLGGALPGALQALAAALGVAEPAAPAEAGIDADALRARLAAQVRAWVDSLPAMAAINALLALVDANHDSPQLLQFMVFFRRQYRTVEHTVDPGHWSLGYWRFEHRFAQRLLDVGRLVHREDEAAQEASRLFGPTPWTMKPDEDAMQRLGNLTGRGRPAFDAEAAESEWALWRLGPGRALAHGTDVFRRWWESHEGAPHDARAALDLCSRLARVFEMAGEYELAAGIGDIAADESRELGDEARRALALVLRARTLALWKQPDAAEEHLGRAQRIADRLGLNRVTAQALAARGLIDVLTGRDADAIAPLRRACDLLARDQRLPALFIVLLDLGRAAFYTGDNETLQAVQHRLHGLCDRFPGGEGHVLLMQAEMARHRSEWEQLERLTDAFEREVTRDADYPWQWGLGRVARHRETLARHR